MKYWVVVVLLGLTAGMSVALSQKEHIYTKVDIKDFPMKIGSWIGKELPLDEETYKILETRNVLFRKYYKQSSERGETASVYLYIIYSEDNRKVSHPPEICYTGGGAELISKSQVSIDTGSQIMRVNKFIVEEHKQKEMVLYWYSAGGEFTTNYLRQQMKVVLGQLGRRGSGASLIRVSAPIAKGEAETLGELKGFIRDAIPEIKENLEK